MKTIYKIIVAILIAISLTAIIFFGWNLQNNNNDVDMDYALVALKDIPPRTQITDDMVGVINLPKGSIPSNAFKNKDDVVGKYTITYYTVPKNSYLFNNFVLPAEEIKDGTALLLEDGERMIAIDVNLRSSLAAQIVEGSYINLWLTATSEDKKPIVGPFAENVRVIGTYSTSKTTANPTSVEQGNNQVNKDKPAAMGQNIVPQTILLAVSDRETALITLAENLGTINVVGTKYSGGEQSEGLSLKRVQNWLESQLGITENVVTTEGGN